MSIVKNGRELRRLWLESIIRIENQTVAWGWTSGSTDALVHCQAGDQISVSAIYRGEENLNSEVYGYSYTTFSGSLFHRC